MSECVRENKYAVCVKAITFDQDLFEGTMFFVSRDDAFRCAASVMKSGVKMKGEMMGSDGVPTEIVFMMGADQIVSVTVAGPALVGEIVYDPDNLVFPIDKTSEVEIL